MKGKISATGIILILTFLITAGCMEITQNSNTITYESHPTSLLYKISYGYRINCSGSGDYEIRYDCDEPEVHSGTVLSTSVHDSSYVIKTLATYNRIYSWLIESNINRDYNLGVTAEVSSNSFMVTDLNGEDALDISEIQRCSSTKSGAFNRTGLDLIQSHEGK